MSQKLCQQPAAVYKQCDTTTSMHVGMSAGRYAYVAVAFKSEQPCPSPHNNMAEQLKTVTSEKQTCSICLCTIRKNSRWWHMTECPQPHFFHWECWHDYRKDACVQGQGVRTRVKCPLCRHPQISQADFMAAVLRGVEEVLQSPE